MRTLLLALLIGIAATAPTRGAEPHTFCGRTVDGWLQVYRDKSTRKHDRLFALWALGAFGAEARAAVPDLVNAFRDDALKVQAADALVRIGGGAEVTVPYFIEQFVKQGCQHLTGMGTFGYSPYFTNSLAKIGGPAVPALVAIVDGPNMDMRVCAAEALGEIGPPARAAVPSLIRMRGDRYAVGALGRIGVDARIAIPVLNDAFDKDPGDLDVVMALTGLGAPPVGKLVDTFLGAGDPFIAAYDLAWLGPRAREAAPALRKALSDNRHQVRISSAVALAHVDADNSDAAIPVLIEALSHLKDEELNTSGVAQAVALFGPRARAALPSMTDFVKRGAQDHEVLRALVQIDPEGTQCVPALITALNHDDYQLATVAARCLGLLGPHAKDAVPALAAAITRERSEVFWNEYDPQESAARALGRIGPAARSAIPTLIAALKYRRHIKEEEPGPGDECTGAAAAARALGSFGAAAKSAVPALIEVVKTREEDDWNWPVREAAISALGEIGPDARPAIPVLKEMLNVDGGRSQYARPALIALVELAPDGRELAEHWLARRTASWSAGAWYGSSSAWHVLIERARVLGAMGRADFESDCVTRDQLERLDSMLSHTDPRGDYWFDYLEHWFEMIGQFRSAGRIAIPRLTELRKHSNPWVRMWARETLAQIEPAQRSGPAKK